MEMHFKLRVGTINKKGLTPVQFFYTHNSPYVRISTGVEVKSENWNQSANFDSHVYGCDNADELNRQLQVMWNTIQTMLQEYQFPRRALPREQQYPQSQDFKLMYESAGAAIDDKCDQIVPLFRKYIETRTNLVYNKIFYTVINDLEEMFPNGIRLGDLNSQTLLSIKKHWLNQVKKVGGLNKVPNKHGKKLEHSTIIKRWRCLKMFLKYQEDKVPAHPSYKNFSLDLKQQTEEDNIFVLEEPEYNVIKNFDLTPFYKKHPNIEYVRQLYILAAESALRLSDVKRVDLSHKKFKDKMWRIIIRQKKTNKDSCVPLSDAAERIILWFEQEQLTERSGFYLSEQKIRDNLSTLFELVLPEMQNRNLETYWGDVDYVTYTGTKREEEKIPKYQCLGFHSSRKYFCTSKLAQGVHFKNVMVWSSHSTLASFARYLGKGINEIQEWNQTQNSSPL